MAQSQPDNPLKLAGSRLLWNDYKPTLRLALRRFLRERKEASPLKAARSRHLTNITACSRSTHTLHMADAALTAPIQHQQAIIKYRMGTFMFGTRVFAIHTNDLVVVMKPVHTCLS